MRSPMAGAVVLFLGTVREITGDRRTVALNYEGYPDMARDRMQALADDACSRWPVVAAAIVHRLGHMALGDISVAVAVSASAPAARANRSFFIFSFPLPLLRPSTTDRRMPKCNPSLDESNKPVEQ